MTQIIINETTPVVVEVSTPGPQGSSGTVSVGTVSTGAAGSAAAVTNSGTPSAAVFNFTIPKGDVGDVTPEATAAKNQAVTAATAAAASELAAETAEQAAEDSATAALASANQASASAATATTKASQASTSASNAAASAQSVESAATTATTKATEASASAASALSSANTATTKAQEAAASATTSDTKAQEAVVSATTATNKATQASSSAATALSAQQVTTDNATLSIAQAAIATTKAAQATTSASTANTKAAIATDKATVATQQAVISTEQAEIATAQATISSTQAGISTTQANAATTAANTATTKASEASASAAAALSSQTSAATSANSATTSASTASTAATTSSTQAGIATSAATTATTAATTSTTQAGIASSAAATATTQAGIATASAASATQVAAQVAALATNLDLTGVTAQALHRSPNAVTAMFVYDTSKDSDGGAWTEKCQHTSWYNEALNGKWLGPQPSEAYARNEGATLGTELVTNGNFSNGTTGWSVYGGTLSAVSGECVITNNGTNYGEVYQSITTVVGRVYKIVGTSRRGTVSQIALRAETALTAGNLFNQYHASTTNTTQVGYFTATGTTTVVGFAQAPTSNGTGFVDNISVREVTALNTASGDYYQSTVDGKFYKLNPTSGVTETFRGNKADFPRLSAIVAEASNVTIYDLTEAGRPMWMRQRNIADNGIYWGGFFTNLTGLSTVSALNGLLAVGGYNGSNGGYGRLALVNFPLDNQLSLTADTPTQIIEGISKRNQTFTLRAPRDLRILNNVNAVAMTVLPDAPVDAVTGLQVPTIAVATAGGTSVIKHNGTVVNSSVTHAHQAVDIKGTTLFVNDSARYPYFATNIGGLGSAFPLTTYGNYGQGGGWQITLGKLIAAARNQEYGYLGREVYGGKTNEAASIRGLGFRIANTFNTGYLIGDIRRAYLADVDVGSVTAPELVVNGTFDTDTTGWTPAGATLASVGGRLEATTTVSGYMNLFGQLINVVPNRLYKIIVDVVSTPAANVSLKIGTSIGESYPYMNSTIVVGTNTRYLFAPSTGVIAFNLGILGASAGQVTVFDNISLKEVVADRSYKAQSASITGTLTKSTVATAAQLVAYSGFSTANYLREPYSADLDFGTGEWSASAWVNVPVTLVASDFPLTGPNLAINGTFDSDTSWTKAAGVTISGGAVRFSNVASSSALYQNIAATTKGKTYRVAMTISNYSAGSAEVLCFQSSPVSGVSASGNGTYVGYSTVASDGSNFGLRTSGVATLDVDDLTLTEVGPRVIAERSHSSGAKIVLGVTPAGFLTATASDGTTTRTVTTTAAYNTATWIKPEAVYTTDGTLAIRVNGVEVAATRGTPLLTLNNASAVLTIGNSYAADAPFPGSIALLKLSATVPTAEQSQWMYEQEKQMFRAGAQVCLPDAGNVVDLAYDDATDKWLAVSATNESEWSGLVRTSVTASPAGSYSKIAATSGIQLQSRTTTNPGVDVTIPSYGLREELVNRSQAAARLARTLVSFDYVGGFTANTTTGSTAIASAAGITYPVSYIGARVTGSGIPADTFVTAVSGTTIYLSKAATATATAVQISFNDFILPSGYETKDVLLAGVSQREGTTQAFVRLFDGFKETVRFNTSPLYTALVQIKATRSIQ